MKLLVPTDYSENATHAVEYASSFAHAAHAKVTLLHIINPVIASPGIRGVMADEIIAKMNSAIDVMKRQVEDLRAKYSDARFNYIIQESETAAGIILKGEEEEPDLIVMGTHGASGLRKALFGSNTATVIHHAAVPVMAVPSHIKTEPPQKIVFATDYYFSDLNSIEKLAEIAASCGAAIDVVHIIDGSENETDEKILIAKFRDLVSGITAYPKFNYAVFRNKNHREGIEDYMLATGADVLAVSTRKRGLFDKLLERSLTDALVYRPHFPILVFQVDESIESPEF